MKTLSRLFRLFTQFALAALLLHTPALHAGLLGPEAVIATEAAAQTPTQAQLDRAKVRHFLESANLKEKLKTLGVDGLNAGARVDALTEDEVHAMAQRIDAMPAGGALSDREWILILLVALLIIVL